jgi:transposase-like protein
MRWTTLLFLNWNIPGGRRQNMTDHRRRYYRNFKAKVVIEVLKAQRTIAEIASKYGVHPNQD